MSLLNPLKQKNTHSKSGRKIKLDEPMVEISGIEPLTS